MAVPVLKLTHGGDAGKDRASNRNAQHIRYIAKHGALAPSEEQRNRNAGHIVYQSVHEALPSKAGQLVIGNAAEEGWQKAVEEARNHEGHQWRWVISLRGDDAQRMGYTTPDDWHRLGHQLAPQLAAAIGIEPEHLRWVAAHHDPEPAPGGYRHPHLHLTMWSAEPMQREHRLTKDELRRCRRAVVDTLNGPERARLNRERTILRNAIREQGARTLGEALVIARELRGRSSGSVMTPDRLEQQLLALAENMPGKGRASLAYMPSHVKNEVYRLTDWILKRPEYAEQVTKYRETVRAQAALFADDPKKLLRAEDSAYKDLRDRVAQLVVKAGAELNQDLSLAKAFGLPKENQGATIRRTGKGLSQAIAIALSPQQARGDVDRYRSRAGRSDTGKTRN